MSSTPAERDLEELGGAATVGDVVLGVADRFATEPALVRDDVTRLLDRFRADGLVTVDDRVTAVRCGEAEVATAPTGGGSAPPPASYRALGADLIVDCPDPEIAAVLERVLSPLHVPSPPEIAIRVDEEPDGIFTVATGDRPPVRAASRLSVVHTVLAEVNGAAVRSVPDHLVFHAGAVTGDEGAVLLPAASNHGKSTLTTALVGAGLGYLTDEAAAVGDDTGGATLRQVDRARPRVVPAVPRAGSPTTPTDWAGPSPPASGTSTPGAWGR